MPRLVPAALAACVIGVAIGAAAHVAPGVDRDNRYLKVSLLGDRVRLAHTVYIGERPGAAERRRLDRDRDGVVSDAELAGLRRDHAAAVAAGLEVRVDGRAAATTWSTVDVGLGTPSARGGAFSIDLVAWYCLGPGGHHVVEVRDRQTMERPGETEVRVEDGPGIRARAHLGATPMPEGIATWEGAGGPLVDDGLTIAFDVDRGATRAGHDSCGAERQPRRWIYVAGGAALVMVALAGGLAWRARRRLER